MSNVLTNPQLEESLQPPLEIACTHCPSALWFKTKKPAVKCYCHRMYLVVWQAGMRPDEMIVDCDGLATDEEMLPATETPAPALFAPIQPTAVQPSTQPVNTETVQPPPLIPIPSGEATAAPNEPPSWGLAVPEDAPAAQGNNPMQMG